MTAPLTTIIPWSSTTAYPVGASGASGASTRLVEIYSTGVSATPTGGTLVISTGAFVPPAGGWGLICPSAGNTAIYMSTCLFSAADATAVTPAGTWTTPTVVTPVLVHGTSSIKVEVFYHGTTVPTAPTTTLGSYDFTSPGVLTLPTGGGVTWTQTKPTSTTDPTYMTSCTFSAAAGATAIGTAWSTPVVIAQNGAVGSNARAVSLLAVAQGFAYNTSGTTPSPASSVFTATALNTVGTVYYDFKKNGVSVQNGVSATYTYIPAANYASMPEYIQVDIREGASTGTVLASDMVTTMGQMAGKDAITGYLTNESTSVPTASDGTGAVYTSAGGTFKVFKGITDVTTSTTFSASASVSGLTLTIGASTGVYSLSGTWTSETANFTLTAAYSGMSITKVYTITKVKAGSTGTPGATTYTWVKYGTTSTGGTISDSAVGMSYIGLAFNQLTSAADNLPASSVAGSYVWSLIKGVDGSPGLPGITGSGSIRVFQITTNSSTPPSPAPSVTTYPSVTGFYGASSRWSINTTDACAIPTIGNPVLWQCDGSYAAGSTTILWGTPYVNTLKVGKLDALTVVTGSLVSATGGVRLSINEADSHEFRAYSINGLVASVGDMGASNAAMPDAMVLANTYNGYAYRALGTAAEIRGLHTELYGTTSGGGNQLPGSLGKQSAFSCRTNDAVGNPTSLLSVRVGVVDNIVQSSAAGKTQLFEGSASSMSGSVTATVNLGLANGTLSGQSYGGYFATTAGYSVTLATPSYAIDAIGSILASGNITAFSDRRLKDNLEVISDPITKLKQLSGYSFDWNGKVDRGEGSKVHDVGLIADEVVKVIPEAVFDGEYQTVDYSRVIPLLVECIKDLARQVDDLKK